VIKYRIKKIVKSILINCHFHDEIENSNNRIVRYESGVMVSYYRDFLHTDYQARFFRQSHWLPSKQKNNWPDLQTSTFYTSGKIVLCTCHF